MSRIVDRIINHFLEIVCSERGYSGLFKAGVALMALGLIALGDAGTFLYERDIEVHRSKFAIEAASGIPLKETACSSLGSLWAECEIAKHQVKTLYSTIGLLSLVINTSFMIGAVLLCLSVIGFLASPFAGRKRSERNDHKPN